AHQPPWTLTGVSAGGTDGGRTGGASGAAVSRAASGPAGAAAESGRGALTSGPALASTGGATPASGPPAGARARRLLVARIAAVMSGAATYRLEAIAAVRRSG